LIVYLSLP